MKDDGDESQWKCSMLVQVSARIDGAMGGKAREQRRALICVCVCVRSVCTHDLVQVLVGHGTTR